MDIIIRPMITNDIADIMRIRTSVFENHMSIEDLAQKNITPETIKEMIAPSPSSEFYCAWVALYNEKIVGFSMVDFDDACIFALFIDEAFQGNGIGQKLLKIAENALFKKHQTIWLSTAKNTKAAAFYRKHNWQEVLIDEKGDIRFEKQNLQ